MFILANRLQTCTAGKSRNDGLGRQLRGCDFARASQKVEQRLPLPEVARLAAEHVRHLHALDRSVVGPRFVPEADGEKMGGNGYRGYRVGVMRSDRKAGQIVMACPLSCRQIRRLARNGRARCRDTPSRAVV